MLIIFYSTYLYIFVLNFLKYFFYMLNFNCIIFFPSLPFLLYWRKRYFSVLRPFSLSIYIKNSVPQFTKYIYNPTYTLYFYNIIPTLFKLFLLIFENILVLYYYYRFIAIYFNLYYLFILTFNHNIFFVKNNLILVNTSNKLKIQQVSSIISFNWLILNNYFL